MPAQMIVAFTAIPMQTIQNVSNVEVQDTYQIYKEQVHPKRFSDTCL